MDSKAAIQHFYLKDDGIFPNNERLPVLIYKNVLTGAHSFSVAQIKSLFEKNNWGNAWEYGVYTYHHYHSITHEVLGIYKGKTVLLLGGERGRKIEVEKGDVLVIPAGVAHKNLQKEDDIKCVGAYPDGRNYDMNYGAPGERPVTGKNIAMTPLPSKDPVFGDNGELQKLWK